MKVLVTGAQGQLGREIHKKQTTTTDSYSFFSSQSLDIRDSDSIQATLDSVRPTVVINCAAYTAVDKAESEPELAFSINAEAPMKLAKACLERNIFFIHFSTDYVFEGGQTSPYLETDTPTPINVYGLSKLEGETRIAALGGPSLIIRTSWLYSWHGKNFVKTILRLSAERPEIQVVADQVGSPTSAEDLASFVVANLAQLTETHQPSVLHFSNDGATSWFDFAVGIQQEAGLSTKITPISSAEFPTVARRPPYSVLSKDRVKILYKIEVADWRTSLRHMLNNRPLQGKD